MAIEIPNQLVAQVTITGGKPLGSYPVNQRAIVRGGAKVLTNANAGDAPASTFLIWTPGLTFWNADGSLTGNALLVGQTVGTEMVTWCGSAPKVDYEVTAYNLANGTNVSWRECSFVYTANPATGLATESDFWVLFYAAPQTT